MTEELYALKALVDALDDTYWSSWQSTARFATELQTAREVILRADRERHAQSKTP